MIGVIDSAQQAPLKSYKPVFRVEFVSYLYEHGPLGLHDHLQQRFDQSLRCCWDQVEKVDDGRTYLHFLERDRERERREMKVWER